MASVLSDLVQKFTSNCGKVNSLPQGFTFLQTPIYKHMLSFLQNKGNFGRNSESTEKYCSISTTFQLLTTRRKLCTCKKTVTPENYIPPICTYYHFIEEEKAYAAMLVMKAQSKFQRASTER